MRILTHTHTDTHTHQQLWLFWVPFSHQKTGDVCSLNKPIRMPLVLFCNNTRWSSFFSLPLTLASCSATGSAVSQNQSWYSCSASFSKQEVCTWGRGGCTLPSKQLRSLRGLPVSFILLSIDKCGIKSLQTCNSPPFPEGPREAASMEAPLATTLISSSEKQLSPHGIQRRAQVMLIVH